jgi:hypothetical protein
MRSTSAVYITSAAEYDKHIEKLKCTPCPKCRVVGCLNRHGYLWGKGEKGNDKVRRGWRFLCSNRNRRKGCGKTHSILAAGFLHHRMTDAKRLWQLLRGILDGLSIKAAWEKVASPFCLETGYRLWYAFTKSQTFIRSTLLRVATPPTMQSRDPNLQLIEHLQSVFRKSVCPICDFQVRFQTAFLRISAPRINRSG